MHHGGLIGFSCPNVPMQIELYNSMLEKEGTEGEEEAKKAYIAAREEPDHDAEVAAEEKVSSALIEKVRNLLMRVIAIVKIYKYHL
jgi:LETM1 and EF-hand domain-containing protein 1